MPTIVHVDQVSKTYKDGFQALNNVSLEIKEGEILALLGPNGAGKTTLISTICGLSQPSTGSITVGGHDVVTQFRDARRLIGLVPQEVNVEPFEKVRNTVLFSRGLLGKPKNMEYIDELLSDLSLLDKADNRIMTLSGGMRRRVLIAKALSHEPTVLFLDEPTAGVDVELRKDMWAIVEKLRAAGATIILTTHYIEEAEAIADRIAVINNGEILLVEEKAALMKRLGRKELIIEFDDKIDAIPDILSAYDLELVNGGSGLRYIYDTQGERTGITSLLADIQSADLKMTDIVTVQSSLEDIFVGLVKETA